MPWVLPLIGIVLGILLAIHQSKKQKRAEDEYFRRMEEAFRRANDNKK